MVGWGLWPEIVKDSVKKVWPATPPGLDGDSIARKTKMKNGSETTHSSTGRRPLASNRRLVLLFFSQSLGMMARAAYFVGLPLFVLERTGSTFSMGISLFLGYVPFTIAGPFAGAVVDRLSRRDLIVAANLLYGAALFFLPFMRATYLIYVTAFTASVFGVVLTNAIAALIPELVDVEHLAKANSVYTFLRSATYLVSMFAAYFLIGAVGKAGVFFLSSLLLLPSGLICLALERDRPKGTGYAGGSGIGAEVPPGAGEERDPGEKGVLAGAQATSAEASGGVAAEDAGGLTGDNLCRETDPAGGEGGRPGGPGIPAETIDPERQKEGLLEALRIIGSERHVRALTLMHLMFMPIFGAFEVLLPVYCADRLGNADYYPLVSAGVGAGLALGSLFTYRMLGRFRPLDLVFASFLGYSAGVFALSRSGFLVLAVAFSFAMGVVDAFGFTTYEYLKQRLVPSAFRGRVFAVMDAVVLLPLPLGYMLMGFFAQRTDVATLGAWLSGIGLALALLSFPLTRGLPSLGAGRRG